MDRPEFDPIRAEAFTEEVLGMLNAGALALMVSLGHRAGLFDVMAGRPPCDAATLAAEAGLDACYVAEWLAAMATGGLVEHDPATGSFVLPPEHAAVLSRAARPHNLSVTAQWIPMLATLEDGVLAAFEHGGGVPLDAYRRFHAVMAEESGQGVVGRLLEELVPRLPGLREALEGGADVLDLGCGSGRALCRLAAAFPHSRFLGIDVAPEAVAAARSVARESRLENLRFAESDAAELDEVKAYDLVTAFSSLAFQAHPERVLARVARALRPGGRLLVQQVDAAGRLEDDAHHPLAPFLFTLSCMHGLPVSRATGGAGPGLMAGRARTTRMLEEAGFAELEIHVLPDDPVFAYHSARAPA